MRLATKAGELAKQLLNEYPTAGSLTLAKRLHKQSPEYFETVEYARRIVRYYRGQAGDHARKRLTDLTHVKDLNKVLAAKFDMPPAAVMDRTPYYLPKINKRILIFGDGHIPYQKNQALIEAVEYGVKKNADCVIMNGDMIDNYVISRYVKDGRKPNVEYDIELFYEFCVKLRETFPKVLIIWKYGNHEERFDNYLKINAPLLYMIGTQCLEDYIPVRELGIEVVKDKRVIIAGDLNILHGHEYFGSSGQVNPARGIFLKAKSNCLVNHFHRSSSHKETDLNGKLIRTFSLGAMCERQDYAPYGNQDCSFGFLEIENGVTYVTMREI